MIDAPSVGDGRTRLFALIDTSVALQSFLVERLGSSAVQRRWIAKFRSLTEGML